MSVEIASIQYFWRFNFLYTRFMLKIFRPNVTDQDSDEALLARYIRTGEADLLGRLYERYMPMV